MSTPTITRAIQSIIDARLAGLHVSMPGKVLSYNATTQRAVVQPLVLRTYRDEDGETATERLPAIPDVPIEFPGTGPFSIHWPIAAGDTIELGFASISLDRWKAKGGFTDPGDARRFALSDAVGRPGLRAHPDRIPAEGLHDTAMVIRAPAEIHVGGDQSLALHAKLEALAARVESHLHSGVTTGLGSSGAAVPAGAPDMGPGTTVTKGQ